jgi:NRAMP (natural resistance-associated macrophage protein)-like metal ion transporter
MALTLRSLFKKFGPGFITGSSDDDPSGIATYTQVGAQFGLGQLWTTVFIFPLMTAVQEMSARIGMVTGEGITSVLRKRYSKLLLWVFVFLLLAANTVNIGSDLGAMADAAHLLIPKLPFAVCLLLFTLLILILEIFLTYKAYANVLKWLCLSLLSYVATAFIVTTNWGDVFRHAIIPQMQLTKDFMLAIVAILGTTISPYLFLWQAHEEIEEEIADGRKTVAARRGGNAKEMRDMRVDTVIGMSFSQIITFFIITTAAITFFHHGLHNIQTSAQAAQALVPLTGRFAALLYTIGIIGTGLLAVPVLSASASYAISDAYGWSEGLYKKFRDAHGFYGVITLSTLVGLLINFIGINPIQALIWSAVLNGLITPPLIAIMLLIANNEKIMGTWKNGWISNALCIATLILTAVAGVLLFVL